MSVLWNVLTWCEVEAWCVKGIAWHLRCALFSVRLTLLDSVAAFSLFFSPRSPRSGLWGVGLIELTNPSLQCCRGARHTRWGSGDVTLRESVAMQYASLEFGLLIQNWRGVNYFAVFLLFFCITVSICDFNMTEWTWIDLIRCPPVSLAVMFSWKMFNCFLIVSQCLRTRTRSWLWWSMPARASCMTTSASAAAWASGRRDTSSDR